MMASRVIQEAMKSHGTSTTRRSPRSADETLEQVSVSSLLATPLLIRIVKGTKQASWSIIQNHKYCLHYLGPKTVPVLVAPKLAVQRWPRLTKRMLLAGTSRGAGARMVRLPWPKPPQQLLQQYLRITDYLPSCQRLTKAPCKMGACHKPNSNPPPFKESWTYFVRSAAMLRIFAYSNRQKPSHCRRSLLCTLHCASRQGKGGKRPPQDDSVPGNHGECVLFSTFTRFLMRCASQRHGCSLVCQVSISTAPTLRNAQNTAAPARVGIPCSLMISSRTARCGRSHALSQNPPCNNQDTLRC
ncbi:hypothetical protein IF1G_09569 [Cordyceps javanica]|uniref:Uncharacterized protein n=1 Tax=Cordyceps javanica TaxID=43265 RepID=A0A545UR92_9HYPO|nr:hypothetical protein IF1G_09569 [Cordyceps javanica]